MARSEELFGFIEKYRHQFSLRTHTHEDAKSTLVEVWSKGEQIVRVKNENPELAYKWAFDLLEVWIGGKLAEIEAYLGSRAVC